VTIEKETKKIFQKMFDKNKKGNYLLFLSGLNYD